LRYVSSDDAASIEGESVYWKYEEHIKAAESLLGSCVSGTGAIYAVRRDGYRAIPDGLPGDFVIPLLLALRGQRVLYQPKAVAREELGNSVSGEARRHIRITSRGAYALLWYPPLRRILNPFRSPRLAWQVWSHKVIRWFTMAFIVAGSVSSATLACAGTLYTTAFAVTIGFSLLGLWGAAAKRTHLPRLFGLPHVAFFFLAVSAGMLVGFLRACFRAPVITWEPKR
jgi:biofilm PGA synthesis N-glycosyltransferase PgaC